MPEGLGRHFESVGRSPIPPATGAGKVPAGKLILAPVLALRSLEHDHRPGRQIEMYRPAAVFDVCLKISLPGASVAVSLTPRPCTFCRSMSADSTPSTSPIRSSARLRRVRGRKITLDRLLVGTNDRYYSLL
jgi:hypothetical protein